ncbi:STAS domain-containing protein [Mycobacterium vicinigordonae]|uniref:STAS domain-containing protein n=1 Tax=Mycobacterium vicinigordonae TaxID=1719132 RepID=A0A7D6I7S7_9MYCO|nr:STAS domain-containing protein [Mycobacterium vicinigordonae]QLL06677.1 STAS domain-containing protein [Mycobacterium vicinigordonae]
MITSRYPESALRGFTSHSGPCTVYCNGTQMRAHCRHDVTVVQVTGEIDATNIDRVYHYAHRFVGVAPGLILDLSEVDFMSAKGIFALYALTHECRTAGTDWIVVTSPAISRLLRIGDPSRVIPTTDSEHQALVAVSGHQQTSKSAS